MKVKTINGIQYKLIFRRYITKNGKQIFPKTGKAFKLWVKV